MFSYMGSKQLSTCQVLFSWLSHLYLWSFPELQFAGEIKWIAQHLWRSLFTTHLRTRELRQISILLMKGKREHSSHCQHEQIDEKVKQHTNPLRLNTHPLHLNTHPLSLSAFIINVQDDILLLLKFPAASPPTSPSPADLFLISLSFNNRSRVYIYLHAWGNIHSSLKSQSRKAICLRISQGWWWPGCRKLQKSTTIKIKPY